MYYVCIIDEDEAARNYTGELLNNYERIQDVEFEVLKFANAESYFNAHDENSSIIFLDVDMSEANGMDVAEKIRENRPNVIIIFCTKLKQFAVNGYEVDALGFIAKPVQWGQFELFLDKAIKKLTRDAGGGGT